MLDFVAPPCARATASACNVERDFIGLLREILAARSNSATDMPAVYLWRAVCDRGETSAQLANFLEQCRICIRNS
jgi:hypothetical protein